jgi:DNA-binding transcriptional LysR family regulator
MKNVYDDLNLFCAVVNSNSFYKASKILNLPHSTVSRRIAALEQTLDEKLIERTTRQMHVTEKGQQLFNQCDPLFQQLKIAISDSLDEDTELKGPLKITMPTRIGLDYMGEFLVNFNQLHPKLELDIQLDNSLSDIVAENIDLALRVGPLADSSAIAVKLWDIPFELVAHQRTIEHFNIDPEKFELKSLSTLPCAIAAPQMKWIFENAEHGQMVMTPNAKLRANDLSLALQAATKTNVLAYVPTIILHNMQDHSSLVTLSGKGWQTQTRTIYAVYTASRRSSQKVKAVIAFAKKAYFERYGEQV